MMTARDVSTYLIENRRQCRTRKGKPCPCCQHTDGHCLRMEDGSAGLCPKSDGAGSISKHGEYGYLYVLTPGLSTTSLAQLPKVAKQRTRTDAELDALWSPRVARWRDGSQFHIGRLAMILGVSAGSLDALCCGWDGTAWTVPERNGAGLIVGVSRRFNDGSKRCIRGSRRGLTYSPQWAATPGPVLLVEGASDVAAGITMGLAAIGRPSNVGGVAMLTELLAPHAERKVIVVGERDKKEDGRYPGWDGAKSVCKALNAAIGRRVSCRLLPGSAKDLRAFWRVSEMDGQGLLKEWGIRWSIPRKR